MAVIGMSPIDSIRRELYEEKTIDVGVDDAR